MFNNACILCTWSLVFKNISCHILYDHCVNILYDTYEQERFAWPVLLACICCCCSLIRTFFTGVSRWYYHFLVFGFWGQNLQLLFLLGRLRWQSLGHRIFLGGLFDLFPAVMRTWQCISHTGHLLRPTADLINFVNLFCVSYHTGPTFWLYFSGGILWLLIPFPLSPQSTREYMEHPFCFSKAWRKKLCKTVKSLRTKGLLKKLCSLQGFGLGGRNTKGARQDPSSQRIYNRAT
jgi:hypothetical protein